MKLRIRENTLRIRITQTELVHLGNGKRIESSIHFPNGMLLTYGIMPGDKEATSILFKENDIQISLGSLDAETIFDEANVGIQSMHTTKAGTLDLLIEKDFNCLHKRGIEDADTFPNPNSKETV